MTVLVKVELAVDSTKQEAVEFVVGISAKEVSESAAVVQWLAERLEAPN